MEWGKKLTPEKVLYQFDEPLIFTVRYGPFTALILKVDEQEEGSVYLAAQIEDRHVEAIELGKVSVRSAFLNKRLVDVIYANARLDISRSEGFNESHFTESVLPKSGIGLDPYHLDLPDALPSEDAIFSIYFKGPNLREDSINFSLFTHLTNKTYSFLRKLLLPPELWSLRNNAISISISEPAFGSLMFSVESVSVDTDKTKRRANYKNTTQDAFNEIFERKQIDFIENAQQSKFLAAQENVNEAIRQADYLRIARDILPNGDFELEEVQFSYLGNSGKTKRVVFGRAESKKIFDLIDSIDNFPQSLEGVIVEINAKSRSFLLRGDLARVTTCKLNNELFRELSADGSFKIGSTISVFGKLMTRPRRDYLTVEHVERLIEQNDFDVDEID